MTTTLSGAAPGVLKRAEEMFRRGDYERARQQLAADTSKIDADSFYDAVLMLARLETDYASAEALYARVIASGSERAAQKARIDLASIRYAAGDYENALALLQAKGAKSRDHDDGEALYLRGMCHKQMGDNERAAVEFAGVTRGKYTIWSLLARADIDAQAGRTDEAIAQYEDIVKLQPNPIALFKLGECHETLGGREKALERYRVLIDKFPLSFEAAKGREKMQLLAQTKAKDDTTPGGGESGEPRVKETKTSRGFTIQFGSFETRGNAVAVSAKMEGVLRGVRIESVEMEGRVWHRVRAGFYETKESAERDAERAKSKTGLAGTVVPLK
ncbi:MAG: tetratricopeptide repeat protein [Candidatus Krumholzibacteria bacterium]|nr:tetratricopeptide repeat protein [Candidatus Krumholzibacteria bacterium]